MLRLFGFAVGVEFGFAVGVEFGFAVGADDGFGGVGIETNRSQGFGPMECLEGFLGGLVHRPRGIEELIGKVGDGALEAAGVGGELSRILALLGIPPTTLAVSNFGRVRHVSGKLIDYDGVRLPRIQIYGRTVSLCKLITLMHNRTQAEDAMIATFGEVSSDVFNLLVACHGKDGETVNHASNLRLDTQSLNIKELGKRVVLWMEGGEEFAFPSAAEAARKLGLTASTSSLVCTGQRRLVKG